jgi:resorcinol 4-hydroxylase (FADH2)
VARLFPILGARGLMSDHPVQRAWRDLRAVSHHLAMTWDIQGSLYGAVTLGLPCPDPRI